MKTQNSDEISKENKQRILYMDYLRILSALAVICIHTPCQVIDSNIFQISDIGTKDWNIAVIF